MQGETGKDTLGGDPVIGSGLEPLLIEDGFSRQPRRLVASASPLALRTPLEQGGGDASRPRDRD